MSTHDDVICFPVPCHSEMVVTYYAVSLNGSDLLQYTMEGNVQYNI